VFCFSFIYFRVQLEFSRNATSINKTALVDTNCDLRRLSVRLSSRIQLCLCMSAAAAAALHNALQFHLKRTCLDMLLFIAVCSQSVYRATEPLEVASSRLSRCVSIILPCYFIQCPIITPMQKRWHRHYLAY